MTTMQFRPSFSCSKCTFHSYKLHASESSPLPFVDNPDRALIPKSLRDCWVPLLVEEVEWSVLGLNRLVALGSTILTALSFVGEKGVELHIFSTLKKTCNSEFSGLSCKYSPWMRTRFGGSWILTNSMKLLVAHSNLGVIETG